MTGFILHVPVNCTGWKVIKSYRISACIFSQLTRVRWEIPLSLECHPCHPTTSWAPELSKSAANLFITLHAARCHFMTGKQSRTWLMSLGWFFSWWWEPTYVPLSPIQPCCCFPYVTEYTQGRKSAQGLTTIKISMGIWAMARVSYHSHCKNPSGAWLCGITPSFCGIAPSLCGTAPTFPAPTIGSKVVTRCSWARWGMAANAEGEPPSASTALLLKCMAFLFCPVIMLMSFFLSCNTNHAFTVKVT